MNPFVIMDTHYEYSHLNVFVFSWLLQIFVKDGLMGRLPFVYYFLVNYILVKYKTILSFDICTRINAVIGLMRDFTLC
jgi:hypothetical protein